MGKLDYLAALRRAMAGLPAELQARTLAEHEQRFVDGASAGRAEAAVAAELDEPKKVAMNLRASVHMNAFAARRNPVNALRLAVSVLGLAIFNLFMVVPAMVYGALLACVYCAALGFYVAGIAITASGLAGASELVLNGPFRHIVIDDGDRAALKDRELVVSINDHGVDFSAQDVAPDMAKHPAASAGQGIRILSDAASGTRTTQTLLGVGTLLGGIALFLVALVVTRYTLLGVRRYTQMNIALLQGH